MFGYRPAAVEQAIEELESELGSCAEELRGQEAEALTSRAQAEALEGLLGERERESERLRSELAGTRARAEEELRSLTVIGRQLEELRVSARGQATRIRLRALREAAELSARLADATDPRGEAERERILDALEDAIDRVAGEWEAEPPSPPISRSLAAPRSNGRPGSGRSRSRVSVDVGPFADFSQLVRFEDAANAIGATGDISIKRFSEGRARIDVALSEPVDLLRELEERCDLEFKVRSSADDEIVLDVDGPSA